MASKSPEQPAVEDPRLVFDRQKWEEERGLRERELRLREADRPSPWRSPLTIAVVAAAMAAAGNAIVSRLNGNAQLKLQDIQGQTQTDLERIKAEQNLIIEAIKTGGDVDKAAANLEFLVKAGLITDAVRARRIRDYLNANRHNPERLPSLPSVGQTAPQAARRPAPEPSPGAALSPRDDPALKVTNRVRTIVPGQSCAAGNGYCVANGVLVDPAGKPVPVADATWHGAKMQPPQLIVLHATYTGDRAAVRFLTAKQQVSNASAHIVIDRDGTVTQLVPFDVASFHVGQGSWNGLSGLNNKSIGIEFSNWGQLRGGPGAWQSYSGAAIPDDRVFTTAPDADGQVSGWEIYTDAQLAAAERIVATLVRKYPTIRAVVGHSEVSAGRKTDPGPALPFDRFRALLAK